MLVSDFDYFLPQELIAQKPTEKRSDSRLMVIDREKGDIKHDHFYNICDYINVGDCVVFNNTRVLPARIFGVKNTGSVVEFLLLNDLGNDIWDVIVRPGRRAKTGDKFDFSEGLLQGEIVNVDETGNRKVKFTYDGIFLEILEQIGNVPLPPYITEKLEDKERYQTVYSKVSGSAAAPTAGLHFTQELIEKLKCKGVNTAYVTLNVGLGTFRPVKTKNVEEHIMHSEMYSIDENACNIINSTKKNGGRIVAVGTTDVRVLESSADSEGFVHPYTGATSIFIYPGYSFKCVDAIITNFHLPQSTLLMLVSAFAGRDHIMRAYAEAVKEKYRFFSFGDATFIGNCSKDENKKEL